ncbi:tryptophan-rich antigen [Plasmodium brasilianum]|nr:tryptophan-rich antigen [Plasmodium brasilianum]
MDPYYRQVYDYVPTQNTNTNFRPAPRTMPMDYQRMAHQNNPAMNVLTSIFSAIMYLFSSTSVLLSRVTQPPPMTQSLHYNMPPAIEFHPGLLGKTEEWKDNEWNKWLGNIEVEWNEFYNTIENEKMKWLVGKEKDWNDFIKFMESKWMHYHENLENIKSDILKKSLTLDENEWKEWMTTEGKELMEKDWKNWINDNESYLDVWSVKEWLKWKNQRIVTWIMTDWKCEEDKYWSKWEESWARSVNLQDRANWLNWRERLNKEMVQWNSWVMNKEQYIRENRSNNWSKWKNDKQIMFNLWMESFINSWIREKQWFIWVKERNHHFSRAKYVTYK